MIKIDKSSYLFFVLSLIVTIFIGSVLFNFEKLTWKANIGVADFVNIFLAIVTLNSVRYSKIAAMSSAKATQNAINQTEVMEKEFAISHFPNLVPIEEDFIVHFETIDVRDLQENEYPEYLLPLDEFEHLLVDLSLPDPLSISFFNVGGANSYFIKLNVDIQNSQNNYIHKEKLLDKSTLSSNTPYIKYYKMHEYDDIKFHELYYINLKVEEQINTPESGIYSSVSSEDFIPVVKPHELIQLPLTGLATFQLIEEALNLLPGKSKVVDKSAIRLSIKYKNSEEIETNRFTQKDFELEVVSSSIKIFQNCLRFRVKINQIN